MGGARKNDCERDASYVHFSEPTREFKLPTDSPPGRRYESSKPQRASKIFSLPRELRRALRAGHTQEDSPVGELVAPEFRYPTASFLLTQDNT